MMHITCNYKRQSFAFLPCRLHGGLRNGQLSEQTSNRFLVLPVIEPSDERCRLLWSDARDVGEVTGVGGLRGDADELF